MVDSDEALIDAALEAVDGLDNVAAARRIGVSEGTVRRWRDGDRRGLRQGTREKLRRYFERKAGRTGDGYSPEPGSDAIDLFSNAEVVTRYFEGLSEQGQPKDVKLEAWENYRAFITTSRPLPPFMIRLREQIENGEI